MHVDVCVCARMYVGNTGDADVRWGRRGRWKTRMEDGAAEADGRRGRRTEPQRQMEDADGGQSRSGRWEPRMEDKAAAVDGRRGWRTEPQW